MDSLSPDIAQEGSVEWEIKPSSTDPTKMVVIFTVAIVAVAFGVVVMHSIPLGALGAAMILGSSAEYWRGSSFCVNQKAVKSRIGFNISELPWDAVRRIEVKENEIYLTPLKNPGPLDVSRGVRLRFSKGDGDTKLRAIEQIKIYGGEVARSI